MAEITREEVLLMNASIEKDINSLGILIREHRQESREDIKSVWKAIDMMLFKVGAVVTIMTTIVMFVFKVVEASGK